MNLHALKEVCKFWFCISLLTIACIVAAWIVVTFKGLALLVLLAAIVFITLSVLIYQDALKDQNEKTNY